MGSLYTSGFEKLVQKLPLVIIGLFIFRVHWVVNDFFYDDAYIHFRIAENLKDFGAPYFNALEQFKSSSSTLWSIYLWVLYSTLGSGYLSWISPFNGLFLFIGLWYLRELLSTEGYLRRGKLEDWILCSTFTGISIFPSLGGMESTLAVMFLIVGVSTLHKGTYSGIIFICLAAHTRLEFCVPLIISLIYFLVKERKIFLGLLGLVIISSLPFLIYDFLFFKTLLPLPVHAKSIVFELSFFEQLAQLFKPYFVFLKYPNYMLYYSFLILLFTPFFILYWGNKRIELVFWISFSGPLIFISYIVSGAGIFPWYLPLAYIPSLLWVFVVIPLRTNRFISLLFLIIISIPIGLQMKSLPKNLSEGNTSLLPNSEWKKRVTFYIKVGEILNEAYPQARLMASEIGGIGYGFRGKIIDGVGLAQPNCLKFHPMKVPEQRPSGIIGAVPIACIVQEQPDIVLGYDIFLDEVNNASRIMGGYQRITLPPFLKEDLKTMENPTLWGRKNFTLYLREPAPDNLLRKLKAL